MKFETPYEIGQTVYIVQNRNSYHDTKMGYYTSECGAEMID